MSKIKDCAINSLMQGQMTIELQVMAYERRGHSGRVPRPAIILVERHSRHGHSQVIQPLTSCCWWKWQESYRTHLWNFSKKFGWKSTFSPPTCTGSSFSPVSTEKVISRSNAIPLTTQVKPQKGVRKWTVFQSEFMRNRVKFILWLGEKLKCDSNSGAIHSKVGRGCVKWLKMPLAGVSPVTLFRPRSLGKC